MIDLGQIEHHKAGLDSYIVIIRHAEKMMDRADDENEINLTPRGYFKSNLLGEKLASIEDISYIKSSPIYRCMETAAAILKGACQTREIIASKRLGDPGVFIYDDQIAKNLFYQFECYEIVDKQLKGEQLRGMNSIDTGVKLFLEEIMADLTNYKSMGIYVTHDAIIAPIFHYITGIPLTQENWFDYLDGMIICKSNQDIFILHNRKKYLITNKVKMLVDNA